jgi:hypothetical protein
MTKEEWVEFNFINEQLVQMEEMGLIKDLRIEVGDSLLTSQVHFSVNEEMLPLILKSDSPTIH